MGLIGSYENKTTFQCRNAVLRSTVDVDDLVGYQDRPWSVIGAPEGEVQANNRVNSSSQMFAMKNLEIRVHIDVFGNTPRLYPTMGAANFMNIRRMHIEDCFFGLDNQVGTNIWGKDE